MRSKTVGRLTGIFGLSAAFVAANATTPLAVTPAAATNASKTVIESFADAPDSEAQAHLDRFFDFAVSPAASTALPRISVTLNGATQWVEPLTRTPDGYIATLVDAENTPIQGETIEFKAENVSDWLFIGRDRKIYGNFQTRAKLAELNPVAAAQVLALLSRTSTPPGW